MTIEEAEQQFKNHDKVVKTVIVDQETGIKISFTRVVKKEDL